MKKRPYSLTAKERKAQRAEKPAVQQETSEVSSGAQTAAAVKKNSNAKWILLTSIICLAAILIAVLVPVCLFAVNPYRSLKMDNPVAKMTLSNGMTIEYEIYEDTCPVAATNFIFLAKKGFFDGTIIFDTQNDWVRFGGFETPAIDRSDKSTDYAKHFDGMPGHTENKFGYRLKSDTSVDAKRTTQEGMLIMMNTNPTYFQVAARDNAQTNLQGNGTSVDCKGTALGRYLNDKSLENIRAITELTRAADYPTRNKPWKGPEYPVRIEKVRIYNIKDKEKWKNFDFETYMKTALNGSTAIDYWVGA